MTSRSTRFLVSVTAALLLAGGASFSISACSSSTDAGAATEAGTDATTDARKKVDATPPNEGDSSTQTPEQCIAACNAAASAAAKAKYGAIDTCWAASCQGPCVDDPSTPFDAGAGDGGDGGVDASDLCGTGLTTGAADCDNCTQVNCCPSWAGCFDDTACKALDTCVGACSPP